MKFKRCKECKYKLKDRRRNLCLDCDLEEFYFSSGIKIFNKILEV